MAENKRHYIGRVGAPPGKRWHWTITDMSIYIKQNYSINYDYKYDNYFLERKTRVKAERDFFIILRTSKNCFRVVYHHYGKKIFLYETFKNSLGVSEMLDFHAMKNDINKSPQL